MTDNLKSRDASASKNTTKKNPMQLLNGIPLPLALLLWAFNILFNPLAIGSCPKGHITRHKPIVKKGLTDLPSIETFLKYLHWVGLETCLNYSWNSERSEEPQTSLKEAVLLDFIQCPFPNQIQFGLEKLHPKNASDFPIVHWLALSFENMDL